MLNQPLSFRAPSKTFLLGEYAALTGGPAILISTSPCFSLTVSDAAPVTTAFAPQSPAGKLIALHQETLSKVSLYFEDPYHGAGGFGASSAQFALLARYLGIPNVWALWHQYRQLVMDTEIVPSGADVVAQWMGGVSYFHPQKNRAAQCNWPFPELGLALIRTEKKIATHEHLKYLSYQDYTPLQIIVEEGYHALKHAHKDKFCEAIQNYATHLQTFSLVAEHTQYLLKQLETCPMVLACKGCGALGADVILAVIQMTQRETFKEWVQQQQLRLIYCDNQFAEGIFS